MEYADFSIRIEPTGDRSSFQVYISSPAGEDHGTFIPPINNQRLGSFLVGRGRDVRDSGAKRDLNPPQAPQVADQATTAREIGRELFKALLTGPARNLFERSLGIVHGLARRGLRLRLHLEPSHPELLPICNFPWELLCSDDGSFLSLSHLTPVVRYLEVAQPVTPLPLSTALRVLIVHSRSMGGLPLKLDEEMAGIQSAFEKQPGVTTAIVSANEDVLVRELRERPAQVVHFMGHGSYEAETGVGSLWFEAEDGSPKRLSGEILASLLQLPQPPALVVLNACNTAKASEDEVLNPFAGVATALVKGGLLAVIAMQYAISDAAAIAFSGMLYERLAQGDPVDSAVAEARIKLSTHYPGRVEWGTPVLFMRTPDGKLFDLSLVPLEEKREAKRFIHNLTHHGQKVTLYELDPWVEENATTSSDTLAKLEELVDTSARRGPDEWNRLMEILLSVGASRSPFSPFNGTLDGWIPGTTGVWRAENGGLVGRGDDPEVFDGPRELHRCSCLTWKGLRFIGGSISSKIRAPAVPLGGGVGLMMTSLDDRRALFAVIRGTSPEQILLELWQRRGYKLELIESERLLSSKYQEEYELFVHLGGGDVTACAGDLVVKGRITVDTVPGFFGLVKFGGVVARFRDIRLQVPTPTAERRIP